MYDPVLEELSDKVRNGEPIGFLEALAVIEYQSQKRKREEEKTLLGRIKKFLKEKLT